MNRTTNCILMLMYLQSGKLYKVSEITQMLERDTGEAVNPRNISEYRKELENAGYSILSITGKNGGYQLDMSKVFPALRFTEKEKTALIKAYNILIERNDFLLKDDLSKAIGKIMSSIKHEYTEEDITIINRYPLSMSEDDLKKRYDFLINAITNKNQIKISYTSQKNIEKEHILDPYDLFMYNNTWYVIGWRSGKHLNEIMYFKLNRISKFSLTGNKYVVWSFYKKNNYIDENGFKNNGEWYHIELETSEQTASIISERIYGKNQEVVISESKSIVKVDMQNKENILSFILGFSDKIKILEPKWLIDELKKKIDLISSLY